MSTPFSWLASFSRQVAASLFGAFSLGFSAAAEEPGRFLPFAPGDGPMVTFVHPEPKNGKSYTNYLDRLEVVYACTPESSLVPKPVFISDHRYPEFVHRVSRDVAVVRLRDRHFALHLPTAQTVPLWEGGDETEFLRGDREKVFFLHRLVNPSRIGITIKALPNGTNVMGEWYRSRDELCVATIAGDRAGVKIQRLHDQPIAKVFEHDKDGFWVVTADEPRSLCHLSPAGVVSNPVPFDSRWIAEAESTLTISPDKTYLALVVIRRDQSHLNRDVVIVKRGTGTIVKTLTDVPTARSLTFGSGGLRVSWLDASHLCVGDPMAGLSSEVVELPSGLSRPFGDDPKLVPAYKPEPERRNVGAFEVAHGRVWFAGDKDPVRDVRDERGIIVGSGRLELSHDGNWAFVYVDTSKPGQTELIDGAKRAIHRVLEGWSYDSHWLPAARTK